MNCLHIDPNTLIRKIEPLRREYDYTFLERLKSYEIPVYIYYHYLLSIEEFKLKNIWNILVNRWNTMNDELNENNTFTKSNYNIKYLMNHENIDDEILNDRLSEFVGEDILKALFLSNIIQGCIVPK
tara:strand:+ start:2164 stop:2544 length:381 start_codon:yes stop_codon:yes gene_type:complete